MQDISPLVAFAGGLISLLSPCIFPMIPVYIGSLCGADSLRAGPSGHRGSRNLTVFFQSLSFIAGFTLVFVGLGAGAGLVGQAVSTHSILVRLISGSLMIVFGLFMLASQRIAWLNFEKRLLVGGLGGTVGSRLRSLILGVLFALAWTPCVGPVLGGILSLAMNSESAGQGSLLLFFYSMGIALPFLAIGLVFDYVLPRLRRFYRFSPYIYLLGGLLLIAVGALVLVNKLSWFSY
ncbi:MAG: cytochrome c biogenesis protein CcdA [Dehalococcoidales bacterium]|nr:cytochrome c biogenesis protein CcdA [Dehalococcoidales bacterium]